MTDCVRTRWWHYLVTAIGLAAVSGPAVTANTTVHGDKVAWSEVTAAFSKLKALPGYRVRQSAGRTTALFEIVPPNSAHITAQVAPGLVLEMVVVGKEARVREIHQGAPSNWRCEAPPDISRALNPGNIRGEVTVTRGADDIIEDTPVHTYRLAYALLSHGQHKDVRHDVSIATPKGLPRRLVVTTEEGQLTQDFFDYGARIVLTLPPCG